MATKQTSKPAEVPRDYDSAWKDAFRLFLPQFLQMFHPPLFAALEPARPIRFLEQELRRLQRRAKVGKRTVDVLAELPLLEGGETWLLLHIEVQSSKDPDFPHRMWVYHYRTYDLYRRSVASMAVLADNSTEWRPSRYEVHHFGCSLTLEYPTFKLRDLISQIEELELCDNPFALVVASHLRAQQTAEDSELRLDRKLALCRRLIRLGLTRDKVDGLFLVIDAILTLDPKLEEKFEQMIHSREDGMELELFTSNRFIDKGRELGIKEGREEGREVIARRMLERGLERGLILDLTGFSEEELLAIEQLKLELPPS